MNKRRKGISLIVLVITILVMIILAGVVVVSLQKNNPIEKAKEAEFKTSVTSFLDELSLYHTQMLSNNQGSYEQNRINANKNNIVYIGSGQIDTNGNIKKLIPSMTEKYLDILEVQSGKLVYTGSNTNEIKWSTEVGIGIQSFVGGVNSPKLNEGMIPVYFDSSNSVWKKADVTNKDRNWYDYNDKRWANVVTVEEENRSKYMLAKVGTEIVEQDINTFFVWIPRFAYSITGGAYQKSLLDVSGKIDIKFLKGISNIDSKGKNYPEDYSHEDLTVGANTPTIVHPAFNFGTEKLSGIWVGKFEISGSTNSEGKYPGNAEVKNGNLSIPQNLISEDTYVKIIPGVPTWRHEKISSHFNICRDMLNKHANKYGIENADSHMIKNTEWGAVAYLSASKYGMIPKQNKSGKYIEGQGHYDIIAGTTDYKKNVEVSTTGNITGIYDMNGGSYEVVAAYIDNKNYGKDGTGVLQKADKKYVNSYPSAKEVLDNKIIDTVTNNGSFLTREELETKDHTYNSIRNRLSLALYKNMGNTKGDAMYEAIQPGNYSYLGKLENGTDDWIKINSANPVYQRSFNWCQDVTLIGLNKYPYFQRGGAWSNGNEGGIFGIYGDHGNTWSGVSTRVVII